MLIVCPNLALDRTLKIAELRCGDVHRAFAVATQAGGKGANAARVARTLGADPLLVGFVGGAAGVAVRQGLSKEGICNQLVEVEGETRFTVALVEDDGTITLVNEPGPHVDAENCRHLIETAVANAPPGELVLLTGSLPPGAPESLYAQLLEALEGYRVIVDAAGAALARCLEVRPYLVKPNSAEARKYGADPVTAAEELVAAGAHWALVTVGADGAILAGNGETLRLIAPAVDSINPTGSGDALAAGILIGLESGRSLRDALRLGVAAAADNTTRQTAGRVERETVDALEPRVEMRRL